jgi:hypothetical protein
VKGKRVLPGKYYGRRPDGGLEDAPPGEPDLIICRRVADFPNGITPARAAMQPCSRCHTPIAFNPARVYSAPLVCMQCAGIQPEPL